MRRDAGAARTRRVVNERAWEPHTSRAAGCGHADWRSTRADPWPPSNFRTHERNGDVRALAYDWRGDNHKREREHLRSSREFGSCSGATDRREYSANRRARNQRHATCEVPMRARLLPVMSVLLLSLAASCAFAAPRAQQVPASGTALANFFASQGQVINVGTDQLDLQSLSVPAGTSFEVRTFGPQATSTSVGTYNSNGAKKTHPALYTVLSGATAPGWYAAASFRSGPSRMLVNLFDALNVLQGTTTYTGANAAAFGIYDTGPGGTFYLDDTRNPGGAAKILAYSGTGARAGWTWFACESSSGSGGDFADFVVLVNLGSTSTPVTHTAWGQLKAMFR